MEKIQLSYSETLFHDEDGNPMMFCVQPSEDSHHVEMLIMAGGGRILDEVNQEVIFLSSNGLNLQDRNNVICTSFIYACCFSDALFDKEDFRLVSDNYFSDESAIRTNENEGELDQRANCKLEVFSKRKMHDMLVYVIKCEDIWKKLEESKVLGGYSWRNIRKNFCFWALEKFEGKSFYNSPMSYVPGHSQENQEARKEPSSYPTEPYQIDVNAERCTLIMEKETDVEADESEKERDSMNCENKQVVVSSTMDDKALDEKECENEGRNYIRVCCRKKVVGRSRVAVIVESDESSSESEKDEMEGVQWQVEGRDEVAQGSSEGINGIIEPSRSRCSTAGVKEKEIQKGSNEWLGKQKLIFRATSSSSVYQSGVSFVLESDNNSEASEETDSSEDNYQKRQVNRPQKRLRLYTAKEDMTLLKWICEKKGRRSDPLTGNRIWKFMEKKKVLQGRSWQSMKERFRRQIVPNLKKYPISQENLRKLTIELK